MRRRDQPLGPGLRIGRAERRNAALADAWDGRDLLLDLVRIGVAARTDDDVLHATGDVDVAFRDVGAVAGLDPAVVEELARLLLVAEIALRHRGPAEFEHALLTLAKLAARIVHDTHVVLLDRMPAGDHLDHVGVIRACRFGIAAVREALALDAIDLRPAPEWRET